LGGQIRVSKSKVPFTHPEVKLFLLWGGTGIGSFGRLLGKDSGAEQEETQHSTWETFHKDPQG
jgi:hypothetical protein